MYEFDKVTACIDGLDGNFTGRLISFEDNVMVINCPGMYVIDGARVMVRVFNWMKGEIIFKGLVSHVNGDMIKLCGISYVKHFQKRNDIRVKTAIPLHVTTLYTRDYRQIDLQKVIPMNVINISASGVLLQCPLDIPLHIRYHLYLPINSHSISCIAAVVRKEKKDGYYLYGCKLVVISDRSRDEIRKFVLRKQLDSRKIKIYKAM